MPREKSRNIKREGWNLNSQLHGLIAWFLLSKYVHFNLLVVHFFLLKWFSLFSGVKKLLKPHNLIGERREKNKMCRGSVRKMTTNCASKGILRQVFKQSCCLLDFSNSRRIDLVLFSLPMSYENREVENKQQH